MNKGSPGLWVAIIIRISGLTLALSYCDPLWYYSALQNANWLYNTLAAIATPAPSDKKNPLPATQDIQFYYTDQIERQWLSALRSQLSTAATAAPLHRINPIGPLPCATNDPLVQSILDAAQLNQALDQATPAQLSQAIQQLETTWWNTNRRDGRKHWLPTLTFATLLAHASRQQRALDVLNNFFSIRWNRQNINTLLAVTDNGFDGQQVAISGMRTPAAADHLQIFTRILYVQGTTALHLNRLKIATERLQQAVTMSRILFNFNRSATITFPGCPIAAGEITIADVFNNLLAAHSNVATLPQNIINDLSTIQNPILVNPPAAVIATLVGNMLDAGNTQTIPPALLGRLNRAQQSLVTTIQTVRTLRGNNQRNFNHIVQSLLRGNNNFSGLLPQDGTHTDQWLSAVRKDVATHLTRLANILHPAKIVRL